MTFEIRIYKSVSGRQPYSEWLGGLTDRQARARIDARITRVVGGNLGDVVSVGDGIQELRIDWGPGYRVYFAQHGKVIVVLLCAGDKRSQQKDIKRAKSYYEDYKTRRQKQGPAA